MFINATATSHEQLFKCVFDTYKKRVYGYVLALSHSAYTAEEITQEIFLKLWACREALASIENLEGYIFAMARNKTLNHLRQAANQQQLLQRLEAAMTQSPPDATERTAVRDLDRLVQEAITLLPAQRRLVYQLSRHEGLNHAQIAIQLQLSRNTVKNHLVHALRFIRDHLSRHG